LAFFAISTICSGVSFGLAIVVSGCHTPQSPDQIRSSQRTATKAAITLPSMLMIWTLRLHIWIYFLSPWGMQFEPVSFPHGKAYENETDLRLWHPADPAA
jgi:hypothetical protein